MQRVEAHMGAVTAVAWHPLGLALASGSQDFTLKLWGREARSFDASSGTGTGLDDETSKRLGPFVDGVLPPLLTSGIFTPFAQQQAGGITVGGQSLAELQDHDNSSDPLRSAEAAVPISGALGCLPNTQVISQTVTVGEGKRQREKDSEDQPMTKPIDDLRQAKISRTEDSVEPHQRVFQGAPAGLASSLAGLLLLKKLREGEGDSNRESKEEFETLSDND